LKRIGTLLLLAGVGALAPVVLYPFIHRYKHRVARTVRVEPIPPEELAPSDREYIEGAAPDLIHRNYRFLGYGRISGMTAGTTACFGLFRNEGAKNLAMATVLSCAAGEKVHYLKIATKYTNGYVVDIGNSPVIGSFRNPEKLVLRYPGVASFGKLWTISRWVTRSERRVLTETPVLPAPGTEFQQIAEEIEREAAMRERSGYYRLDEQEGKYRLTWLGAFEMTLTNAIPFRNLRNLNDLRAARQAIRGMWAFA
jgi:hypothetical protein